MVTYIQDCQRDMFVGLSGAFIFMGHIVDLLAAVFDLTVSDLSSNLSDNFWNAIIQHSQTTPNKEEVWDLIKGFLCRRVWLKRQNRWKIKFVSICQSRSDKPVIDIMNDEVISFFLLYVVRGTNKMRAFGDSTGLLGLYGYKQHMGVC